MNPKILFTRHLLPAVVAAFGLGAAALPACAQGTAEQQEACTPDALKFCAATIPDIPKTTACMKAHKAELSTRCQAAFNDATETAPAAAAAGASKRRRAARLATSPDTADQGRHHRTARAAPPRDSEDVAPRRAARAAPGDMDRDDMDRDDGNQDGYGPRQYEYLRPEGREDGSAGGPRRYDYAQPKGPDGPAAYGRAYDDPPAYDAPRDARGPDDRARASDEIGRLCADGMLDPRSCELTQHALDGGR